MTLKVETVRYAGGHSGTYAVPERAKPPLPAIVVIQEAWGVDAHIEDVARRFAAAGYAVLAPDLYAKDGVRPSPLARERLAELQAVINRIPRMAVFDEKQREAEMAKLAPAEGARVRETFGALFGGGLRLDPHVPALLAATGYLRTENEATRGQKIGSVGFCLGGGLSALLACHDPELAVAVVFYGSSPPLELVPKIRCPVFGFYGGEDARINDGLPAFEQAMKSAGKRFESRVYPGAQHAFHNDNRPAYDVTASRDAFARTLEIFRTHIV
jgi:carboxymethylenebutenolidase